jgi:hypothetical protein
MAASATTEERLLGAAAEHTGLDDFGDDWFRGPLAAWAADLDDGVLTDAGRRFFTALAVQDLARRLRVLDVLRQNPEIDDVPIPPIVYITGLARSGTTLLHNLLALHDRARPMLRWELMEPVPPPEAATYRTDPRIAKVQASIDKRRGSDLERMHWVDATDPEECTWAFIDFVSLLAGAASASMPRWGAVFQNASQAPAYRSYRRILQLLLWKNPPPEGGFLVLKAPQTAPHIDDFAMVFPEARFVVTDRDPYRTLQSTVTLLAGLHAPFIDPASSLSQRLLDQNLQFTARSLEAIARYDAAARHPAVHVPYPALIADPVAQAIEVFEHLPHPPDGSLGAKIEAFLAAQKAGARLAPPSKLHDIAVSSDIVRSHPGIADYCELHRIGRETRRLTGTHA